MKKFYFTSENLRELLAEFSRFQGEVGTLKDHRLADLDAEQLEQVQEDLENLHEAMDDFAERWFRVLCDFRFQEGGGCDD